MKIAIVGTVGVPGNYGGFETLAENLVSYHQANNLTVPLCVYCSYDSFTDHPEFFKSARLEYVKISANGFKSIFYDFISMWRATRQGCDVILLLGVSGALAIPFFRTFFGSKFITNIDGVEWRRAKWGRFGKIFLRLSEYVAVKSSSEVISDNMGIYDHVIEHYGRQSRVLAYGGDHAVLSEKMPVENLDIPESYILGLCRIEPENNIEMILRAFSEVKDENLVFVGNWDRSEYGIGLKSTFKKYRNIYLLDPIYDAGQLRWVREGASAYLHGHSAGGTNPSLVEMMHFGIPIFAYDCIYNRHTTENSAHFFKSANDLKEVLQNSKKDDLVKNAESMELLAKNKYTWSKVASGYFDALLTVGGMK